LILLFCLGAALSCQGPAGPQGTAGLQGTQGPAGEDVTIPITITGTGVSGSDIRQAIADAVAAAKTAGGVNDGSTATKAFTVSFTGIDLEDDAAMKALFMGVEDYYVHLDLSALTGNSYRYYPLNAVIDRSKILSLVLPSGVSAIANGSSGDGVFNGFTGLQSATAANVTSVGSYAFYGCANLASVSLPAAASIGERAFCLTGNMSLTVTLGNTAPTLGTNMFDYISVSKTVTVKVPSGATGYGSSPANTTDNNWGNAFRGKGWDGIAYLGGTVNSYVMLTIQYE
jgi:hypothetical protein